MRAVRQVRILPRATGIPRRCCVCRPQGARRTLEQLSKSNGTRCTRLGAPVLLVGPRRRGSAMDCASPLGSTGRPLTHETTDRLWPDWKPLPRELDISRLRYRAPRYSEPSCRKGFFRPHGPTGNCDGSSTIAMPGDIWLQIRMMPLAHFQRHHCGDDAEKEPQRDDPHLEGRGRDQVSRHPQLIGPQVIRRGGVRRPTREGRERPGATGMPRLGLLTQPPDMHVLDHSLAQRCGLLLLQGGLVRPPLAKASNGQTNPALRHDSAPRAWQPRSWARARRSTVILQAVLSGSWADRAAGSACQGRPGSAAPSNQGFASGEMASCAGHG